MLQVCKVNLSDAAENLTDPPHPAPILHTPHRSCLSCTDPPRAPPKLWTNDIDQTT